MPEDRLVGGLRCSDVMHLLADYVDGELNPAEVSRVEGHLRGCDWCERFGGDYASIVAALRSAQANDEPLDPSICARLRDRLRRT